jgi:hypothetical protein
VRAFLENRANSISGRNRERRTAPTPSEHLGTGKPAKARSGPWGGRLFPTAYVLEVVRGKLPFDRLKDKIIEVKERYGRAALVVEEDGNPR